MLIIPAIDLKDQKVVRLKQGRMTDETVYSDSVLDVAEKWVSQGAKRLHLVDLNGAFEGAPVHFEVVTAIAKKFPKVQIEIGGGIRNLETVQRYIDHGATYCILGTVVIKDPDFVFKACDKFQRQIILGIDARDGFVAAEGWDEQSNLNALALVSRYKDCAVESVIYTDIAKDGMLKGMNLEKTAEMQTCGFPVIASGGLTSLEDIDRLNEIGGFHGVIAGRAIYEGVFSVDEAIRRGC